MWTTVQVFKSVGHGNFKFVVTDLLLVNFSGWHGKGGKLTW